MQRRKFVELTVYGSVVYGSMGLLSGCVSAKPTGSKEITLRDDLSVVKRALQDGFADVHDLIQGNYDSLWIRYPDESANEGAAGHLRLAFVNNAAAPYRHLRIEQANGEVANLVWDREGVAPAISFVDDEGTVLERDGTELTYSIASAVDSWDALQGDGLLEAGVHILAVGFAAWLGVQLAGAVLSAIAFLTYIALVLGLIFVAMEAGDDILAWIVDKTGWSEEQLQGFFDDFMAHLDDQLDRISDFVEAY